MKLGGHFDIPKIKDEININIELQPRSDYKIEEGTMNDLHPNNSGFFFIYAIINI